MPSRALSLNVFTIYVTSVKETITEKEEEEKEEMKNESLVSPRTVKSNLLRCDFLILANFLVTPVSIISNYKYSSFVDQ